MGRWGDLEIGGLFRLVALDGLLRATTKNRKKVVDFFEEKVHPHTKSWLLL